MKLSNQQALFLFDIAKDTLDIANRFGGLNTEQRYKLINEIFNQQDKEVIELRKDKKQ